MRSQWLLMWPACPLTALAQATPVMFPPSSHQEYCLWTFALKVLSACNKFSHSLPHQTSQPHRSLPMLKQPPGQLSLVLLKCNPPTTTYILLLAFFYSIDPIQQIALFVYLFTISLYWNLSLLCRNLGLF